MSTKRTSLKIYWPFTITAFVLAVLLSLSVLDGDASGRINLLHLLLIYCLLPLLGLGLSIVSLLSRRQIHTGYWLARLNWLGLTSVPIFRHITHARIDQLWLLAQSQMMALAFSVGALVVFFTLLLFTDVTFVWRSTLLEATSLQPLLQALAWPWSFWDAAQPSLELLSQSRDFRLETSSADAQTLSRWWPFVVAVQITYAILPRLLMWLVVNTLIWRRQTDTLSQTNAETPQATQDQRLATGTEMALSEVPNTAEWVFWDAIAEPIKAQLQQQLAVQVAISLWQGSRDDIDCFKRLNAPVVVVKAWEPPLAELGDMLAENNGYVLPLHWQGERLQPADTIHLQEWQRFVGSHGWTILRPDYE